MSTPKPTKAVKAWAVVDLRDGELLEMPEGGTFAIYIRETRAFLDVDALRERLIPVLITPLTSEGQGGEKK